VNEKGIRSFNPEPAATVDRHMVRLSSFGEGYIQPVTKVVTFAVAAGSGLN
jgi:hypothetical protein